MAFWIEYQRKDGSEILGSGLYKISHLKTVRGVVNRIHAHKKNTDYAHSYKVFQHPEGELFDTSKHRLVSSGLYHHPNLRA